jgi:RHH-type proline utilization regulon transcriptional repressor/proline dehydrogenase/delta 1-pyrroline-5-carboxylate dehydrogenase
VLCISPWNFPLAIFTGQVSAALAAGNTVLAKPAEQTSLIAAAAVSAMHRAGIPAGAVQLLPGKGETVGAALVASPVVRGVLFTGSTSVAHLISRQLAQRLDDNGRPIPLVAETGGLNAMVVDSSALAEQVIADVLTSAFDSAGQRCSALRLLCVQEDCAEHVLTMLRGALKELRAGNPDRLGTDVGPVIDAQAQAGIQDHIQAMREAGHAVHQLELGPECRHGYFVPPTLIELDEPGQLRREVFGPVLHVVRYRRDDLDSLIDAINASGYGLTFGVHTRLDETVVKVSERIHAGNVYVNRNVVGAVVGVQPFGGEGLSGTGPKAGGPLYLLRLLGQHPAGLPQGLSVQDNAAQAMTLCGPTGETNLYKVAPRGTVLCIAATAAGARAQYEACTATGNKIIFVEGDVSRTWVETLDSTARQCVGFARQDDIEQGDYQAVLFEGDGDALRELNVAVAARPGPIIGVQGLSSDDIAAGQRYHAERLLRETSVSINTTAAGGNASLMMIG